jgi:hypothetical protein
VAQDCHPVLPGLPFEYHLEGVVFSFFNKPFKEMREFMEMVMKMGAMSSAFVQYMLGLKGYGKSHKIYHY